MEIDIVNPIYDAAFKYLMDDKKVAALIIGAITGFDIEDVQLRPTELVTDKTATDSTERSNNFTVYRLDFAARVKSPEGSRVVIIEIQKAKYYTDILRFRRYLGTQYASPDNVEERRDKNGVGRKRALPIYSIYILGHELENIHCPVIQVKRNYIDAATGVELKERDEFIESLTHDSSVIQIPQLKQRRRNRLERMLSIFDQALIDHSTRQILHFREDDYPEEFRPIIRRLLAAIAEQEVRKRMTVEDEMISQLESLNRAISDLGERAGKAEARAEEERLQKEKAETIAQEERRQKEEERRQKEEERRQKEEERRQKEEERRQKEEERRQKEEERRQKEEERREKEEALTKLEMAVQALVAAGKSPDEARRILGLVKK